MITLAATCRHYRFAVRIFGWSRRAAAVVKDVARIAISAHTISKRKGFTVRVNGQAFTRKVVPVRAKDAGSIFKRNAVGIAGRH